MSDKKNVLITGGDGFLGSNLAERLTKERHKIFSIDDYSFGKKENEFDNIKYIKDDIENISSINESIDICYHLVPALTPGGITLNTLFISVEGVS